ncbi:hypothetical protein HDU67_006141, partial [Dinochytrium kinnereticum]
FEFNEHDDPPIAEEDDEVEIAEEDEDPYEEEPPAPKSAASKSIGKKEQSFLAIDEVRVGKSTRVSRASKYEAEPSQHEVDTTPPPADEEYDSNEHDDPPVAEEDEPTAPPLPKSVRNSIGRLGGMGGSTSSIPMLKSRTVSKGSMSDVRKSIGGDEARKSVASLRKSVGGVVSKQASGRELPELPKEVGSR